MFNFSPKEDKFFDMFITFSETLEEASALLKELMNDTSDAEEKYRKIKAVEHKGDQILHSIYLELNDTFLTPIDREDIHLIGRTLDDILDWIDITASRIVMFRIKTVKNHAQTFTDMIIDGTSQVTKLIKELKIMKKSKLIGNIVLEINTLEDNGDALFRKAVSELFDGETPILDVITWKEIYEKLECTLNSCESLSHIVNGVVLKNV